MPQYCAMAERMLGVTENKILGEADLRLNKMADLQGVGDTFYRVRVATFFSASSLGTTELLFRLKQRGSLPRISDDLGVNPSLTITALAEHAMSPIPAKP